MIATVALAGAGKPVRFRERNSRPIERLRQTRVLDLMLAARTPKSSVDDGVSRRDFLRFGGLGMLSGTRAEQRARAEATGKGARRCIFILLTGGPSQLDTFDPKPLAPAEIRGPYRPIATATPGLSLAETLPRLAERSQSFVVVRSLNHDAAPLHETGQQLLQTGRLLQDELPPPSMGSMVSRLLGGRQQLPAYVVLPRLLEGAGASIWQGQGAGWLGSACEPWLPDHPPAARTDLPRVGGLSSPGNPLLAEEPVDMQKLSRLLDLKSEPDLQRRRYGETEFGRSCLTARRLTEAGVRFVGINMYDSLGARLTWDCHANPAWAPTTVGDYRHSICPGFDQGLAALLEDLEVRGLLSETLVVASGEFGRTPRLNERGGRDHWTGVWSALLAGAGIAGGRWLGASDSRGGIPAERPVSPAELSATILTTLGIDPTATLELPDGGLMPLADAAPIAELVG